MNHNGYLALILNNVSSLSMGPTHGSLLLKKPSLLFHCASPQDTFPSPTTTQFDMDKLDLAFLQKSPFTHGGVKSRSISDNISQ